MTFVGILQLFWYSYCQNYLGDNMKNSKNALNNESTNYELIGLTVHIGTLEMGHYVAYSKRYGRWYLFNDVDC